MTAQFSPQKALPLSEISALISELWPDLERAAPAISKCVGVIMLKRSYAYHLGPHSKKVKIENFKKNKQRNQITF
ncbi:MAG: hypothetical protein DHS20C07_21550 [Methyloligella sp.]|nr:MAG: hypothetical protein DHS20C07_21550 [Methyloligella sp.]